MLMHFWAVGLQELNYSNIQQRKSWNIFVICILPFFVSFGVESSGVLEEEYLP